MSVILPVLTLVLVVGALIDIIVRDEARVKHLPKIVWVLLVVLLPVIGAIVWFAVGRDWSRPADLGGFGDPRRRERPAAPAPAGPSQTELELARLDEEIARAEREDRLRRLEQQVAEQRRRDEGKD